MKQLLLSLSLLMLSLNGYGQTACTCCANDSVAQVVDVPPLTQQLIDSINARVDECTHTLYSQMADSTMQALLQAIAPYYDSDFSMQMADIMVRRAIEQRDKIDCLRAVLAQPYDTIKVELARRHLCELESCIRTSTEYDPQPWTELQWAEVQTYIEACAIYHDANEAFEQLVAEVAALRAEQTADNAESIRANIDSLLAAFTEQWQARIHNIPYLDARFRVIIDN